MGFYHNDRSANTVLSTLKWYHIAFVFDCDNRAQSIYVDGVIDGSGYIEQVLSKATISLSPLE